MEDISLQVNWGDVEHRAANTQTPKPWLPIRRQRAVLLHLNGEEGRARNEIAT